MARTYRRGGDHGETTGRDGDGAFKHWTRNDCEDFRSFWDPKYDRNQNLAIIAESADSE